MSGLENGLTWSTAFRTIQAAIAVAQVYGAEVWVAEGVYDEHRANSTGSLVMQQGVNVYGGFAGTETTRDTRDLEAHVTTIDGSTARNGSAAYHVVLGANNATLDGFTITGGNATGTGNDMYGAGMFNSSVSPTVIHCIFTGNSANHAAGGMQNSHSSPSITACTFTENTAGAGGGVMDNDSGSAPTLTACLFLENSTG